MVLLVYLTKSEPRIIEGLLAATNMRLARLQCHFDHKLCNFVDYLMTSRLMTITEFPGLRKFFLTDIHYHWTTCSEMAATWRVYGTWNFA